MYTSKLASYDIDLSVPEAERWADVIKHEVAPARLAPPGPWGLPR